MLGRARLSAVLPGVAGVVLFASLFMPWYSAEGDFLVLFGQKLPRLDLRPSAWRAFSVADIGLAAVALYLLALAVARARGRHPTHRAALVLGLPVVAALIFVVVRIADPVDVAAILPDRVGGSGEMRVKYGAVVALAALLLAIAALVLGRARVSAVVFGVAGVVLFAAVALGGCGGASEQTKIERAVREHPNLPHAQIKRVSCDRSRDAWDCSIKLRSGETFSCAVSGPSAHIETTCIR